MPGRRASPLLQKAILDGYDKLNSIKVPISSLRLELAKIEKEGNAEYPLGELMLLIKTIISEKE